MATMTIKGPAIPVHQPGSNKFFDIYGTTYRLTYHPVNQEAGSYYNTPLATFTPNHPEQGPMRDIAIFPKKTTDRIRRTSIRNTLNGNNYSETSCKYRVPRREFFHTPLPRHKYLEDWSNKDGRLLTRMSVSEYSHTIGERTPAAQNLPLRRKFDVCDQFKASQLPSLQNTFRPRR